MNFGPVTPEFAKMKYVHPSFLSLKWTFQTNYLRIHRTYFHGFYQFLPSDDAFWPSKSDGQVNFRTIENPRWWTLEDRILKNQKSAISRQRFAHKIWLVTQFVPPNEQVKFPTSDNPSRRPSAAILKNRKSAIISSTFDHLARNLAWWRNLALRIGPAVKISNF